MRRIVCALCLTLAAPFAVACIGSAALGHLLPAAVAALACAILCLLALAALAERARR